MTQVDATVVRDHYQAGIERGAALLARLGTTADAMDVPGIA